MSFQPIYAKNVEKGNFDDLIVFMSNPVFHTLSREQKTNYNADVFGLLCFIDYIDGNFRNIKNVLDVIHLRFNEYIKYIRRREIVKNINFELNYDQVVKLLTKKMEDYLSMAQP